MATADPVENPAAGGGGGLPTDLTYDTVAHLLLLSASDASLVAFSVANTANTASAEARLKASVGGASAGNAGVTLTVTGGAAWTIDNNNSASDRLDVSRGATLVLSLDPTAAFNQARILADGVFGGSFSAWSAAGNTRTGATLFGLGLSASQYFSIGPDTSGTAGRGLAGIFYDGTNWQNALSWAHAASAGTGFLKLMENGGNVSAGGAALATNATDGHFKIPTCAGTPSGTPTPGSGSLILDTTAGKIWSWTGAAWKGIVLV